MKIFWRTPIVLLTAMVSFGLHSADGAPGDATSQLVTASHILGPWTAHSNPCQGTNDQTTFGGQSSSVLPLPGQPDAFIFMADRWIPSDLASSRYIWLPIQFKGSEIEIEWRNEWTLGFFHK